mmetsp:Transcript_978/g.2273  ORF Transcript_978/g.2273 Transcript_978/m.2273 type:complete len:201 (+) Transcript_978:172-774(+)
MAKQVNDLLALLDGLPIELDDDVARVQAGSLGRSTRGHLWDQHAGGDAWECPVPLLELAYELIGELQHLDADVRPDNAAVSLVLVNDKLGCLDGNGEANAISREGLEGVNPDHFTLQVHKRPSRVPLVDCSIRLDVICPRAKQAEFGTFSFDTTNYTCSDRVLQMQRRSKCNNPLPNSDLSGVSQAGHGKLFLAVYLHDG